MFDNLSAGSLFASIVVSAIGLGFFLYGKRQHRPLQLIAGIALMVYPYFVTNVAWMLGICVAAVVGLYLAVRAGW